MPSLVLQSDRMELTAATGALAHAAAYDPPRLGVLLNARVPEDWPPEIMRDVMEFFASHAASHEHELGWGGWYLVTKGGAPGFEGRVVVGTAGFKGPPKDDGSVEVGYSVLPAYQRRGLASEATRRLIAWAFDGAPRVQRVFAETFPDPTYEPSRRVMIKCGMSYAGANASAGTIQYVIERDVYELTHDWSEAAEQPRIAGVHHVQIMVPRDREREAREFYCNVLGMREIPKPPSLADRGGFWVQAGAPGSAWARQVHVGVEDAPPGAATGAHVAYQVTNLDAWRARLAATGLRIEDPPPIPGFRRFQFRDPFGNRVEMIEASGS